MEEYNIGKEIKEEMRKQGMTVASFAAALHRERQTVYDMFNRTYIATDRLMEVSRLLNRDFFKELSDVCKNGSVANAEEEAVIKERISLLTPEDKLHIIRPDLLAELADEYFLSPRTKPLMVFYENSSVLDTFHCTGEEILGAGMIKTIKTNDKELSSLREQIEQMARLPYKAIEIYYNTMSIKGWDDILLFAKDLTAASGKFVILYCYFVNHLYKDSNVRVASDFKYAENCFDTWNKDIHIFVADNRNNDFARRQEIYNACRNNGYITKFCRLFDEDKCKAAKLLEEAATQLGTFAIVKEEEQGGCIRRHIVTAVPTAEEKELLEQCKEGPVLSMWYDIANGEVLNHEHTISTQIGKALMPELFQ